MRLLGVLFTLSAAAGCSGSFESGNAQTGGSSGADASAGGQAGGRSSGGRPASTGGVSSGGASSGGVSSGGVSNGGASNGGSSSDGSSSGGSSNGGSSGSGQDGGGACPRDVPANGSPCTPPWTASTSGPFVGAPIAHCTWGDDPRPGCRTSALCDNGVWSISTPRCTPLLPAGCPTSPPASDSNCSDTSVGCWYDSSTRCFCSSCMGGFSYPVCQTIDPPHWYCVDPSPGACPYPLPQAGSPCDTPGLNCGLDCSSPIVCKDGVWQWNYCQSCCPVCASPDTPVATPLGDRAIASLKQGDIVYSVDNGAIVAVPVLRVGSTQVVSHRVVRVTLDSGAVIELSAGHPTADGRKFGELRPGSRLDDVHFVQSFDVVPYRYGATYDILPASSTGAYFAAGALVGSTLSAATRAEGTW